MVGAVVAMVAAAIVAALLSGGEEPGEAPGPSGDFIAPVPPPDAYGPLAVGIDEANPHLVAPGPQPPEFAPWRDRLLAIEPRFLRVLIDWRRVQPSPSAGPDWAQPADGCLRGIPPCAPFSGIVDELRAAKAAGMQPVVVILNTPEWAAVGPSGCEGDAGAHARMTADLEAYRVLVRSLLELGEREGIALPWWSAWNEPNHPTFFGPQRARCDASAPVQSAERYAELVRAMKAELDAAPGRQRILLGETAGFYAPRPAATSAAEFAAALPRDVVCSADVWAQHAYVKVDDELAADATGGAGAPELLRDVERALDVKSCEGGPLPIWITETGASPHAGQEGCRQLAEALGRWWDDPRVSAAFQYTFREDTEFRSGLADERLTELRPAYAAWKALADDGRAGVADPAAACAGGAAR
ncbi:MAG TPA: hypothetical protein VFR97_11565 [Capillimicrobium sp.]|nr:hypothetical protein [Capillimicrobium sp.]